jgi:hypothetical protein
MTFVQRNCIVDRLNTNIVNSDYEVGDLIYYKGKCYNHNNFYAIITKKTKNSMDIEVLEWSVNQITGVHEFRSLEPRIEYNNLTKRPFKKIIN